MTKTRSPFGDVVRGWRCSWKTLALTDLAYKVLAFIILTPFVGMLLRVLIAASGNAVLADQDILIFFLGPVGWLCLITVGALWLGIVALEQSALMAILAAAGSQRVGVVGALRFASVNAWPVVQVTARVVVLTLLAIAPFLAVAAAVYFTLLSDFDINYYLKEKPPAFLAALGIGGVLVAALLVVLLRLFTGWFFALPLVLFENCRPSSALRLSRERAHGHRLVLLGWIVGWALATLAVSAVASSLVIWPGRLFVPHTTGSLAALAVAGGATLVLWAVVNLAVNLLSTTTFTAILFGLYRQHGCQAAIDVSRLEVDDAQPGNASFRITRRRLLVGGIVGVAIAAAVGAVAIRSVQLEDKTEVTAHRGASGAAPENTMAAIRKAIEDGADWVEIDVQETADGEVVVFHDSDFMKLSGVDRKIWDATLDDLKDIDIGSWFGVEFQGERVPTLSEVLDECKGKVGVNIELKYYGHDAQLEQRVVDIVESHDMAAEIVVMSLKLDAVKKMKALRPDWKVGLLMSVSAGNLKNVEADFLAVNAAFASRPFVRSAHENGMEVHVWTVNDAPTMSAMIGRGVDRLITDKPALARSVLEQRAGMSTPERLLVGLAAMLGVVPEFSEQ